MVNKKVEIQFKNGSATIFYASEFDVDIEAVSQFGPIHPKGPTQLLRYSYKGTSGDEMPLYLTASEIAAIVVEDVR